MVLQKMWCKIKFWNIFQWGENRICFKAISCTCFNMHRNRSWWTIANWGSEGFLFGLWDSSFQEYCLIFHLLLYGQWLQYPNSSSSSSNKPNLYYITVKDFADDNDNKDSSNLEKLYCCIYKQIRQLSNPDNTTGNVANIHISCKSSHNRGPVFLAFLLSYCGRLWEESTATIIKITCFY